MPHFEVSEDKQTLTIYFHEANPPVAIVHNTAQVDEMLFMLGALRGSMTPEVPFQLSAKTVEAVPNPTYLSGPEAMTGGSLLHLRHPWFGWLSFLFPKHEATHLASFLKMQAEIPETTSRPN